jgi:hypothetical protein
MPWLVIVPVAVFMFDLLVVAIAWFAGERRRARLRNPPAEPGHRAHRFH